MAENLTKVLPPNENCSKYALRSMGKSANGKKANTFSTQKHFETLRMLRPTARQSSHGSAVIVDFQKVLKTNNEGPHKPFDHKKVQRVFQRTYVWCKRRVAPSHAFRPRPEIYRTLYTQLFYCISVFCFALYNGTILLLIAH